MGDTIVGAAAADIAVQYGTNEQIAEALGTDVGEDAGNDTCLVLNDMGNDNALILEGTPADFLKLAERVRTAALDHDDDLMVSYRDIRESLSLILAATTDPAEILASLDDAVANNVGDGGDESVTPHGTLDDFGEDEDDEPEDICLAPDGHWYVITYGRARWEIHAKRCPTCLSESWTCPGCGRRISESDADMIADHVRDCDEVDGSGRGIIRDIDGNKVGDYRIES